MSNVKGYTNKQLLRQVKKANNYAGIPKGYWILGVKSTEDEYNIFDDKFYLFHGTKFVMVSTGTVNPGGTVLKNYSKYNNKGALIVKSDEWYYDLWAPGMHNGRMKALKQVEPILYYRDGNKNNKSEEIGIVYSGIRGINFHTASYDYKVGFIRKLIGGWSAGCQVVASVSKYYKMLKLVWGQPRTTFVLIKEF